MVELGDGRANIRLRGRNAASMEASFSPSGSEPSIVNRQGERTACMRFVGLEIGGTTILIKRCFWFQLSVYGILERAVEKMERCMCNSAAPRRFVTVPLVRSFS